MCVRCVICAHERTGCCDNQDINRDAVGPTLHLDFVMGTTKSRCCQNGCQEGKTMAIGAAAPVAVGEVKSAANEGELSARLHCS